MELSCLYVAINVGIEVIPCLDLAVSTQVYVNICVYSNNFHLYLIHFFLEYMPCVRALVRIVNIRQRLNLSRQQQCFRCHVF